jgi:hypothetical protein
MNSTGQNGEKAGYKVILLLVVGLTAFSSAMKELNQLQQFTLDASRLIAELSDKFAPAQIPQVPQVPEAPEPPLTVEVHTANAAAPSCDSKQSAPSIELPWLSNVPKPPKPRAIGPRPSQIMDFKSDFPRPEEIQIAKLKKLPQFDVDQVLFQFRIPTDSEHGAFVISDLPVTHGKTKTRKAREIRISPRDRELFFKSVNRSINLRFAS